MSDETPRPADDEAWMYKAEFAKAQGISERTIDLRVKAGRVERIVDLDRRALFRVAPSLPGSALVAQPEPPQWAKEIIERQIRIEAKLDALSGTQSALPRSVDVAPPARVAWWRRLLLGE